MSVTRKIWSFAEAELWIFPENSDGVASHNTPLFRDCYMQDATLTHETALMRRAVTGRGRRKITRPSCMFDYVTLEIGSLFFRKAVDHNVTDIFNTQKQLRVVLRFFNIVYSNVSPFENDRFELSHCFASKFSLRGNGDELVEYSAVFNAELLLGVADSNRVPESAFA